MLSRNHQVKKPDLGKFVIIMCCLLPAAVVYLFASIGVEMMSIGGFIPFLMLLLCPIAYLARALLLRKSSAIRYLRNRII